jgi:hypothetical protein
VRQAPTHLKFSTSILRIISRGVPAMVAAEKRAGAGAARFWVLLLLWASNDA